MTIEKVILEPSQNTTLLIHDLILRPLYLSSNRVFGPEQYINKLVK